MTTVATTTSNVSAVDVAGMQTKINNIRSRIAANRAVRAQDIIDLAWVYNTWIQHNHSVYDYSWIAYGNTSPYPTSGLTIISQAVAGATYYTNIPSAGVSITAADIARLIGLVNNIRSHFHTFTAPGLYTAISAGFSATGAYNTSNAGLQLDGVQIAVNSRSYHLVTFDTNGNIVFSGNYDLYGAYLNNPLGINTEAARMANDMNAIAVGTAFVITTEDEPSRGYWTGGLPAAMSRFGSTGYWGQGTSGAIPYRSSCMLIGHVGQAATFEAYVGGADDPNASIAVSFKFSANQFVGLQRLK